MARILKKEVYQELGGYDEDLSYGEFQDIRKRTDQSKLQTEHLQDFEDSQRFRRNFKEVYSQGKWYGKTFIDFLKKYPEEYASLFTVFFFFSIPFVAITSLFVPFFRYLLLLEVLMVVYISLEAYRQSGSVYGLFVPLVKFVRSIGMAPEVIKYLARDGLDKVKKDL